jgi:hypothetical protein
MRLAIRFELARKPVVRDDALNFLDLCEVVFDQAAPSIKM